MAPRAVTVGDAAGRDRWLQKSAVDPVDRFPLFGELMAGAAEVWTESFCALAGTEGVIAFAGLRATRVGDLPQRQADGLSLYAVLRVPAWEAVLGLGLDRLAVATVVEAFFGGGGDDDRPGDDRPVSPIEMRIVDVVGGQLAAALSAAFRTVLPLKVDFERTLPKPETGFLGKSPTALLVASFELKTIGRSVVMELLVPQASLDAHGGLFTGDGAPAAALDEAGWTSQLKTEVSRAAVPLEVGVALRAMTLRAVADLRVGQVIELPPEAGSALTLQSGDEHLFRCSLGQSAGFYTVRVEQALDRSAQPPRKERSVSIEAPPPPAASLGGVRVSDAMATETADTAGPSNLEAILGIPVSVQVMLGGATMPVADLMRLARGAVIPLDHRVGEPVDIVVNGRVIARGEMVVLDEDGSRLGVSLTEIVGQAPATARAA